MKQTKTHLGTYNQKRSSEWTNLSKTNIRIWTRILLGHKLNGIKKEDECKFCREEDDKSIHLLSNCFALCTSRFLHLRAHEIEERELPILGPPDIVHFLEGIELIGQQ